MSVDAAKVSCRPKKTYGFGFIPWRVRDCDAVLPALNGISQHVALHEVHMRIKRRTVERIALQECNWTNSEVEIGSTRQRRGAEKGDSSIGSGEVANDVPYQSYRLGCKSPVEIERVWQGEVGRIAGRTRPPHWHSV